MFSYRQHHHHHDNHCKENPFVCSFSFCAKHFPLHLHSGNRWLSSLPKQFTNSDYVTNSQWWVIIINPKTYDFCTGLFHHLGALPWPCGLCDQFCCIRVTQPIDHYLFLTVWSSVNPGFLFTLCTIPNQSQFLALTLFICKFHHHSFCCQITPSPKLLHLTFQFMKCNSSVFSRGSIYQNVYESFSELCCNKKSSKVWHFFKQKFAWFIKTLQNCPNVTMFNSLFGFHLFVFSSFSLSTFLSLFVFLSDITRSNVWGVSKVTLCDQILKWHWLTHWPRVGIELPGQLKKALNSDFNWGPLHYEIGLLK